MAASKSHPFLGFHDLMDLLFSGCPLDRLGWLPVNYQLSHPRISCITPACCYLLSHNLISYGFVPFSQSSVVILAVSQEVDFLN